MIFGRRKQPMGRLYQGGETILCQGEEGACLYVVLEGQVAVVGRGEDGTEVRLATLEKDDVFGEMALLDHAPRSATVRAVGRVRVLTVDKRSFMRRVHEDPALALRVLERFSLRIRLLNEEVVRLRARMGREGGESHRNLVMPAFGPMPAALTFSKLLRPSALYRVVREWNLLGWAVALQAIRWMVTATSTMMNLYLNQAPMLLPPPFGLSEGEYRFLEVFGYGPYGLVIMSLMAWVLFRLGQPHAQGRPVSWKKMWEVVGFAYFAPWLPTILVDNVLTSLGMGGPLFLIPWHLSIVAVEAWFTTIGLRVVFGMAPAVAGRLGAVGGLVFVCLAGLLIR